MTTIYLANLMGPQGLFILFVLLLLFGAKKLPELARGMGQAVREFSKAKNEIHEEIMREPVQQPRQIEAPQVAQTQPAPVVQAPAAVQPAPVEAPKQPPTAQA